MPLFTHIEEAYLLDSSEKRVKTSVTSPERFSEGKYYLTYMGQEYEIGIQSVKQISLGEVAEKYFRSEGFKTKEEFLDHWKFKMNDADNNLSEIDLDQLVWHANLSWPKKHHHC